MLNKCSNPSCRASFHTLGEGRLFRVEPDPILRTSQPKRVEYYWLCNHCASTMTLRLGDWEDVIAVEVPSQLRSVPDLVAVTFLERKQGLILQAVPCQLPKRGPEHVRSRIMHRRDVA